jgi:4-amino-4-deoxy-L-arabinose transferase-like glycosyltransferase
MFAVLALALVIAPLAASAPLFDPDEGLHAAIAQEMVQRGDYVTPTFMGEPFLDKPILFFWAEAASLKLFGHDEAAVRIPPLMFGLFGMITVAMLGRSLFGARAGLLAGIAYGTMLLPMGVSEVAVHDIGLVPFMCVAALCLNRAASAPNAFAASDPNALAASVPTTAAASALNPPVASAFRRKILKYGIIAGISLGLSILTKGLVGVVFTCIFAACLAAYRPPAIGRLALVLTIAGLVAAIVAAPWYIAMERAHHGYLYYYFVERHLHGYLTATQRHGGRPFWYYVPIVVGGALPWTGYLVGAARIARRTPLRLVLWAWFVVGLVFLSIGESKLVTYALPLFPALAILIGDYVDRATRSGDPFLGFAFLVHVATLAMLPAIGLVLLRIKFDETRPLLWLAASVIALAILLTTRRAWRTGALIDGVVVASVLALVGLALVTPHAAAWMTGRDLAAALNAGGTLPSRVSVLDERIGSLVFYLDPALRAGATKERVNEASFSEAMARVRVDPADAVLAVRDGQLPKFNRLFAVPPAPEAHAGTFTIYRAGTLREALKNR